MLSREALSTAMLFGRARGGVVKSVQYMQHRKGLRRVLLLLEQLGCNPVCDTTVFAL